MLGGEGTKRGMGGSVHILLLENMPPQHENIWRQCSHKEVYLPQRQLSRGELPSTCTYKLHKMLGASMYLRGCQHAES